MKRSATIAVAVLAFTVIAGTALAAWLSLRETADSSFTAGSATVRVDIGDAETTALFTVSDMQPGDFAEACFRVGIDLATDSIDPATEARIYSGGVTGTGLEDHLLVTIIRDDPTTLSLDPLGIFDCRDFAGSTPLVTSERLSTYGLGQAWGLGDSLGTLVPRAYNKVDLRVLIALPASTPGTAAGTTATASWIVEDQ